MNAEKVERKSFYRKRTFSHKSIFKRFFSKVNAMLKAHTINSGHLQSYRIKYKFTANK